MLSEANPVSATTFERIEGLRSRVYASSDYQEGINAFLEKRPAKFTGGRPGDPAPAEQLNLDQRGDSRFRPARGRRAGRNRCSSGQRQRRQLGGSRPDPPSYASSSTPRRSRRVASRERAFLAPDPGARNSHKGRTEPPGSAHMVADLDMDASAAYGRQPRDRRSGA